MAKQSVKTRKTTYIGSLFEVVETATTTQYRHNIIADGQVIAVHTIDGSGSATTSYLHYDHLGSVDAITNDQGTIAQQMSFDVFGLRRDPSNWDYDLTSTQIASLKDDTDRGYTDQEQLDNVGLIHMNGRVYDPGIGRFISADPIEGGNRYAYVEDSPLDYTDPSGFVCGAADGTEACTEMDGGSGYVNNNFGITGQAGADNPYGGGGDGGQQNDNHDPATGKIQDMGSIGAVTVKALRIPWSLGLYPSYLPSWQISVFSYLNPSISLGVAEGLSSPSRTAGKSNSATNQQGHNNTNARPPCNNAGNALSPQQYAALGSSASRQSLLAVSLFGDYGLTIATGIQVGNLLSFRHGGPLDAQASGAKPSYANYAYGAYMAGAGYSLGFSLWGANLYASTKSYPSNVAMGMIYPSTPAANIINITSGYNDEVNATLCGP